MSNYPHEIIVYNNEIDMRFSICENKGIFVSKHWHNSLELIYMLDGQYDVTIENKKYTLHPDNFIVINSKAIHSTSSVGEHKHILLQIPYEFLKKYIHNIDFIEFTQPDFSEINSKSPEAEHMKCIFQKLYDLYKNKPDGYVLKFYSLIFELLFCMNENFKSEISPIEKQKYDKYIERLSKITSYLRLHYAEDISLTSISSYVSLNPEYFARFFKKYMGTTFLEYLNSIRLEYVYNDLISTDYSISEILAKNGFTNYKLFMKMFKKRYGCTPGEKRKQSRLLHKTV